MSEYQPRYTWRPTGLDKAQNYTCHVKDRAVGRIYLADEMSEAGWFWAMHAHGPDIDRKGRKTVGYAATPREAARHVEEAWDAAALR